MSLFTELQRRNVVRVGAAYALIAWVVAQVVEFAFESFGAPDWAIKSVVVLLLLGLPFMLVFAWVFEMTPEGLKREKDITPDQSITAHTGKKVNRVIFSAMVIALVWFASDKFLSTSETQPAASGTPVEQQAAPTQITSTAPDNSVAVLPFVAMSSGPDDDFFADGLTEEILNSLAQLPELLVTARTSAFVFKGEDIPSIPEIAKTLGVKHIVEGSVRRSGERLRVTAQLIRADDGFHLWSENYDSSSADTISVQENIAEKIAVALDVVLDDDKSRAMRQAGLRDVEAFTLYQKGKSIFEDAHGEIEIIGGLREANLYFEEVIELVPNYAPVYIDHSDLFVHLLNSAVAEPPDGRFTEEETLAAHPKAIADYEAAVRHARSRDERLHADLDLAFISGSWRGMAGRLDKALATDICAESNWAPTLANPLGYAAQHRDQARILLACDPLRSLSWFDLARSTLWTGDKVEALRIAREGSDIAPGAWLYWILVRALIENGMYEEARDTIDLRFQDADWALAARGLMAAKQGNREALDEIVREYGVDNNRSFFNLSLYAWSGDRENANRLAATYDEHPFGPWVLWQHAHWCACDAPFDLESTPNLARMNNDNDVP